MEIGGWHTFITASIGATTGIIALVWNIIRDKRGGRVGLYHALISSDKGLYENTASVTFINKGKQNIKLEEIGFQSALGVKGSFIKRLKLDKIGFQSPGVTKGFLHAEEFGLPKWIVPNDSYSLVFTLRHIENLRKMQKNLSNKLKYIYVRDATDKYYYIKITSSIRETIFG